MKFCDICGLFVDNDTIIYKCACKMIYGGDPKNLCIYSETFNLIDAGNAVTDLESNRQFIINAAFDPTASIVKKHANVVEIT